MGIVLSLQNGIPVGMKTIIEVEKRHIYIYAYIENHVESIELCGMWKESASMEPSLLEHKYGEKNVNNWALRLRNGSDYSALDIINIRW